MTNTIELRVDGESIDIEVEPLSALETMLWAGKAPGGIKQADQESEVQVDEGVVEFLVDLTTSQTILTEDLLQELPQNELTRLFNGVVVYSFDEDGELPERGADQYRVGEDKTIEWNDDGSLDLDDWR